MAGEGKVLRALVVEDREDDALLLVRLLQREGYAVRWRRVDGREALREALEGEPWDVVLCDFRMPRFDARQALQVVRAHDPDMPFVVVSGTVGEDVAAEMMRAGANDYVMKDNLTRLPAAVTRELREADERRARRWGRQRLAEGDHAPPFGVRTPLQRHLAPPLARLEVIERQVSRDRENPRAQGRLGPELPDRADHPHERLLEEILRRMPVADEAVSA